MKITLKKILEGLAYETLSFMADSDANGTIVPDQIPKVIGRVNAVLRKLAVKFVLSEKTVMANVTQASRVYALSGDVGRILGIITPNGRMHNLNDVAKHDSIMLKDDGKTFVLDALLPSGSYTVVYKAKTPEFKLDGSDQDQEIEIPEGLLNALYLGVAAITYEGIGGTENIQLARDKWQAFQRECDEAKLNSAVEVEEFEDVNLLKDRGFK